MVAKTILLNTFGESVSSTFATISKTFSEFDGGNTILFQIKVWWKN